MSILRRWKAAGPKAPGFLEPGSTPLQNLSAFRLFCSRIGAAAVAVGAGVAATGAIGASVRSLRVIVGGLLVLFGGAVWIVIRSLDEFEADVVDAEAGADTATTSTVARDSHGGDSPGCR